MTGDRINPPSDQLEQPKVAKDDNLERHRDDANRMEKTHEYRRLQRGETSESLYNTSFKTKDSVEQVNLHIKNMAQHIMKQSEFINSSMGFKQSQQDKNFIKQTDECIACLSKAASDEDGLKDWQNTREKIDQIYPSP